MASNNSGTNIPKSKVVVLPGVTNAIEYVKNLSVGPDDGKLEYLVKNNPHDQLQLPQHWLLPTNDPTYPSEVSSEWLSKWRKSGRKVSVHVLVTGSLHLVGRAMAVLKEQDMME